MQHGRKYTFLASSLWSSKKQIQCSSSKSQRLLSASFFCPLAGPSYFRARITLQYPQANYFLTKDTIIHFAPCIFPILCTLPVTSCSGERSFSGLKRIKRSTMGNQHLSSLTPLHLHRDIHIKVEDIVDDCARRHPRRLKLANILSCN